MSIKYSISILDGEYDETENLLDFSQAAISIEQLLKDGVSFVAYEECGMEILVDNIEFFEDTHNIICEEEEAYAASF